MSTVHAQYMCYKASFFSILIENSDIMLTDFAQEILEIFKKLAVFTWSPFSRGMLSINLKKKEFLWCANQLRWEMLHIIYNKKSLIL